MRIFFHTLIFVCIFAVPVFSSETIASSKNHEPYVYTTWETFYVKDGLPNDHIFAIKVDGDRVWIGTENGLALFENGSWTTWLEEDGLPWRVVSAIAVSQKTGDVWIGMLGGGVARFSGGRFDHFNQLNSGLANDVVYGITVDEDNLWVATTAGTSSYNTVTGEWEIFTEKNAPMEEIWCYSVNSSKGKVYVAVWGGGVIVWDTETKRWDAHRDPDHEMELDLFRDDGLIHNITTSVSLADPVLWVSTYFGLSRYDGRYWRGFMDHDSALLSSFINHITAVSPNSCVIGTDQGLSVMMDFETDTWVNYHRSTEDASCWDADVVVKNETIETVSSGLDLPNHFVICTEVHGDDIWIGTGHGLAKGIRTK